MRPDGLRNMWTNENHNQTIWEVGDYAKQQHGPSKDTEYFKVDAIHFFDPPDLDYKGLVLCSGTKLYLAKYCEKISYAEYIQGHY